MKSEKDYLFDDMFDEPVKFDETTKNNPRNKQINGNVRLSKGLYRTDEEKEKYRKQSLERDLR